MREPQKGDAGGKECERTAGRKGVIEGSRRRTAGRECERTAGREQAQQKVVDSSCGFYFYG